MNPFNLLSAEDSLDRLAIIQAHEQTAHDCAMPNPRLVCIASTDETSEDRRLTTYQVLDELTGASLFSSLVVNIFQREEAIKACEAFIRNHNYELSA